MPMSSRNDRKNPWIKWWTKETVWGSFQQAPLDDLGFFLKMCCLSNEMRFPGQIKANETEGFTHDTIARFMLLPLDEFERLLERQKVEGRITENDRGILTIAKFNYFQAQRGIPHFNREVTVEGKKRNKGSMASLIEGLGKTVNETKEGEVY
jgi:hypothetical protein